MTVRHDSIGLVLLAALALVPLATSSPYVLTTVGLALIFAIIALGANLIIGIAGQASFAHAAFFGLGAYVTGLLTTRYGWSPLLTLPVCLLVCYAAGYALAYPALRVHGFYLALLTLALSEIIGSVAGQRPEFGAAEGIAGIPPFGLGDWVAADRVPKYVVVWVGTVLAYSSMMILVRAHVGRIASALSDSELGAMSIGVNLRALKTRIFSISALYMGFAGFLYAHFMQYVSPAAFGLNMTILIVSMIVIGGLGNILGAFMGALILSLLPQLVREYSGVEPILYGGLLVVILLLLPEGIVPAALRMLRRWREGQS